MALLTFSVYIGVALFIGYKTSQIADGPTNTEILHALENGAADAIRSDVESAAAEQAVNN